ncbi:uncharacterized protein [Drosophila tropicalis]|uniref:uncharacterized protein n=1 Tax=Drosophila tropicalis TaxID=46794 RepID=UPI0035ABEF7B
MLSVFGFLTITWLILAAFPFATSKRQWEYELLSIDTFTSDESKLKIDFRVVRMGRGEFGFSGEIAFNYDADETTMVEGKGYRSTTGGESDYKVLPFDVPEQPYTEFLDKHYKNLIINNLAECSNLPQYEGDFVPPWPKDTYIFDKCIPKADGYPDFALEGYYKMVFKVTGPVNWGFTAIARIITKRI